MTELVKAVSVGTQTVHLDGQSVQDTKPATEKPKGWLGRSLSNYQTMHEALAAEKGVHPQFMAAKTLTAARKILFGK